MSDPLVRQAMAYATDRAGLQQGDQRRASSRTPTGRSSPARKWYTPTNYPNYDLAKAKQLVDAVHAEDRPSAHLHAGRHHRPRSARRASTLLQQMWQQAGMKVTIKSTDQSQFISDAVVGNYQANLWRQFGAVDPDTDALWWYSANAGTGPSGGLTLNIARNKDPQIDAALDKGRQSTDEADRKAAYDALQQRFAADIPYVWLQHVIWVIVATNNVRGLTNGPLPDGSPRCPSAAVATSAAWSAGPRCGRPTHDWPAPGDRDGRDRRPLGGFVAHEVRAHAARRWCCWLVTLPVVPHAQPAAGRPGPWPCAASAATRRPTQQTRADLGPRPADLVRYGKWLKATWPPATWASRPPTSSRCPRPQAAPAGHPRAADLLARSSPWCWPSPSP